MSYLQDSKSQVLNNAYDGRDEGFFFSKDGAGYIQLPRYTTAERDAVTEWLVGAIIYNSTTDKLNFYTGSAWEAITSA